MTNKPGHWNFAGFYPRQNSDTEKQLRERDAYNTIVNGVLRQISHSRDGYSVAANITPMPNRTKLSNSPTVDEIVALYPSLKGQVTIYDDGQYWQIDAGGVRNGTQYNVSIIKDINKGHKGRNLYEISVKFEGRTLPQLFGYSDDIINALPLELALEIAAATLSKDKNKLKASLDSIDYTVILAA